MCFCPRGLWACPHFFSFCFLSSAPQLLPPFMCQLTYSFFCCWFLLVYFHISVIVLFICLFVIYKSPAAAAAKSLQLSLTLCDPIDGSPPGSPFPGILQARTLEWVAISSSNAWKSPSSLLNVSMSSWSVPPPLFFCDLVSSVLSLLWVVIHLDCLHLIVVLILYLVPSSWIYFSAISFCVTFCVCGFLSSGSRIIVPLASGVFCLLVGEVGWSRGAGFLVGGAGACPLVGRARSCPFSGQNHVKGCV